MHTWFNCFPHTGNSSITHWYSCVRSQNYSCNACFQSGDLRLILFSRGCFYDQHNDSSLVFYLLNPFAFFLFPVACYLSLYNTVDPSCLETILDVRLWLSNKVWQESWSRFTRGLWRLVSLAWTEGTETARWLQRPHKESFNLMFTTETTTNSKNNEHCQIGQFN